ncbi:RAM signaling pathway protein-domain-containing protein [Phaeosphaeria sp. MPI-PUGE-AT-0046c]|nr:RAM signaling pathway protein-domain-containing protein [Phaeosphaeria sp. MPI-PUGE-AT-0046c]
MSHDAPTPISDDEVVALAKAAFEHSRSDLRAAAESAPRELQQQQPGITIDLGHKSIARLPDEVIDVIRAEIESRNKIKSLPSRIANLTSLKVLAIAKNKIEELPLCLGDINSLQVLKLDGNPLVFPPPDVCTIKDERQRLETERLRVESSGDESWTESNPETPRPSKRANGSGVRFPVRPSVGKIDGFANGKADSPGATAPPIPTRSHFRVQSQTSNNGSKRPPISPLVLTNGQNERNRSQSEGAGPSTHRQKRMGIYTNKASELGSVDELRRASHFRGFSQGIVVPANSLVNGMSGPATAIGYGDTGTVRSLANRPLSDVREHRRGSRAPDIVVEAAKNFLYAISVLHDCVSHMVRSLSLTARNKESLRRKEDFYRRYQKISLDLGALNNVLRKFDSLVEEDEEDAERLSRSVYVYTLRCLESFMSVSLSIAENRTEIAQNANPRIVRTFLLLQQGTLIELRNGCSVLGAQFKENITRSRRPSGADTSTVRAQQFKGSRRFPASPPQRNGHHHMPPPVILHSTDTSRSNTMTSITAATPRSGESNFTLATTMSRSNTMTSNFDESDEDTQFGRVYQKLRTACDSCNTSIPQISQLLREQLDALRRELDVEHPRIRAMADLIEKSNEIQHITVPLARRLYQMQPQDSYTRGQPEFWQHCMGFIKAWGELAAAYTQQGKDHKLQSFEVKQLMKPLHRTVKEASLAINDSPWSHLTANNSILMGPPSLSSITSRTSAPRFLGRPTMSSGGGASFPGPINTSIPAMSSAFPSATMSLGSQGSGGYPTPVPATPLSAALGAAAQATVPNTPGLRSQSSSTVNFFERADRLMSQSNRRI